MEVSVNVWKHLLSIAILGLWLAACGTGAAPDDGWVELDEEVVLDEGVIERVTPALVEPVTMTLTEAQTALPFAFALPAWAPEGFALQDEAEVVQPASGLGYVSVSLTWLRADEVALRLQVAQADDDQPALGAAGEQQVVTVNEQPAVLVHVSRLGGERLALTWPRGDLTYTLTVEAGAATAEDLRRMAESVE